MEILNIKNLTFKYPGSGTDALDDVSLSVNEGELILVCGASGSGKTTLLRLLKPEIAPHGEITGNLFIEGNAIIAIVSQDTENQIVSDSVWHNLAFGLECMNKPDNEIRRKVAEIAEFFDITHLFKNRHLSFRAVKNSLLTLRLSWFLTRIFFYLTSQPASLTPLQHTVL